MGDDAQLQVIRVNSTLNNSENKIQQKFMDVLGLTRIDKGSTTSIEMAEKVREFYQNNPHLTIVFIFEDIDFYVETTKQLMLYKILDILTQCQVRFVFLATSMKFDVADSFEKRIKSRFSHRCEMLYDLNLNTFKEQVCQMITEKTILL